MGERADCTGGQGGRFVVYGLVDPRDGSIRYVGRHTQLGYAHEGGVGASLWSSRRKDAEGGRLVRAWFRELDAAGLRPSVRILERPTSHAEAIAKKNHWLASGRASGWPLLNVAPGHVGGPSCEAAQ